MNYLPLDDYSFALEASVEEQDTVYESINRERICAQFSGVKRQVVEMLIDGDNFYNISKKLHMDKNNIYKLRDELKQDFAWVFEEASYQNYLDVNRGQLGDLVHNLKHYVKNMTLSSFAAIFINDYNPEAQLKAWKQVPLQDVYYSVWKTYQKSIIKAPREHLKTTSVEEYLIKRIFERDYPLEIIYLHLNKDIATEKVRNIQTMVERNALLSTSFMIDQARNWKDGNFRLLDGTTITAGGYWSGVVGKHPHIIVLDDVIDQSVIYSDDLNDKAIRKFYSDYYPMITKVGQDKQILVIGTAQREDDLYESLPKDFHALTLQAVVNEDSHQVLEPNLFTWDDLMKVKTDMSERFGERYWLKEYMNMPLSAMGMIVKPEWIKKYVDLPEGLECFDYWDLSPGKDVEKGDWTAGVRIGVKRDENAKLQIYVVWVKRARIEFGERLKLVTASGQEASPSNPLAIGVEQNVFQYDTVKTLKDQTSLPIVGVTTLRNKIEKFRTELAPHFENGKVYVRADMVDLINELLSLPVGKHDDMCDALTGAIQLSSQYGGEPSIDFL